MVLVGRILEGLAEKNPSTSPLGSLAHEIFEPLRRNLDHV